MISKKPFYHSKFQTQKRRLYIIPAHEKERLMKFYTEQGIQLEQCK